MDFLTEQEITDLLAELGVSQHPAGEGCVYLNMDDNHVAVKHCLDNDGCLPCGGDEETRCFDMPTEAMIQAVVGAIHKIHEGQTVLIPAGKWRSIFDAVAYSMAEDEPWQEFDASATIRLNTRDPLLFEPGDEHTLANLLTALMKDGETEEQSVFLIPAGAPLLMHICPCGPVKLWFGNSALADEVSEVYAL